MDRKIATAYCALVTITTISAFVAVVWFGPGSSLETVPGFRGLYDSVWSLFTAPALLTLTGLFGTFSLTSTRIYARPDELSSDAQRGLDRHRNAERHLLIGFGILVAFVQLLVILSTAGFVVPFESGARTFFFVFGALFANAGNTIPKIPFFSRWWQFDRAIYTKVVRFSGWALTIAGISICLLAVFAPIDSVRPSVAMILGSAVGSTIIYALLQVLLTAKKPA